MMEFIDSLSSMSTIKVSYITVAMIVATLSILAGFAYIGFAIRNTVVYYAWHRKLKFITETPYSHELDPYVPSDERCDSAFLDIYARFGFYAYFPTAFVGALVIIVTGFAAAVVWPVSIVIGISLAILEIAYKLNGQNRMAAEIKGEFPDAS